MALAFLPATARLRVEARKQLDGADRAIGLLRGALEGSEAILESLESVDRQLEA